MIKRQALGPNPLGSYVIMEAKGQSGQDRAAAEEAPVLGLLAALPVR